MKTTDRHLDAPPPQRTREVERARKLFDCTPISMTMPDTACLDPVNQPVPRPPTQIGLVDRDDVEIRSPRLSTLAPR